MKTFIEIWHEDDTFLENWFAVRSLYRFHENDDFFTDTPWMINGTSLSIYTVSEIEALRKLLDKIEEEISASGS